MISNPIFTSQSPHSKIVIAYKQSVMVGIIYNQGILSIQILQKYKIWFVMQTQLLNTFNHYAFNHTTHIFISLLNKQQIQQLLIALEEHLQYSQLAHLLRANLFVTNLHQIDRTLYFLHFDQIPENELIIQRCNLIAVNCEAECLKKFLIQQQSLEVAGKAMFGEEYDVVREAIISPDLAMPPLIRQNIAPHCQTVYQIVLATQKLQTIHYQAQIDQIPTNQAISQYFYSLLKTHVRAMDIYLSSFSNPLEHFAQITYRLMVYTNTVLALHSISPFANLSSAMQLWKNALFSHYELANKVFAEVGGFSQPLMCKEVGRIAIEVLIEEGYLRDYCEGLVDLSMSQDILYCEHSRRSFGESYSNLENVLIDSLKSKYLHLQDATLEQRIEQWQCIGLKTMTLSKIIELFHFQFGIGKSDSAIIKADLTSFSCNCYPGLNQIPHIKT